MKIKIKKPKKHYSGFKGLIGTLILIASIILAVYTGVWVMFIGGIVQIINALQGSPVEGLSVAFGVIKIICASGAGWLIFVVGAAIASTFAD